MSAPEDEDDLLDEFGLGGEQGEEPAAPDPFSDDGPILRRSKIFSKDNLGSGIQWATTKPGIKIDIQVNFMSKATWQGAVFGKALGDPSPPPATSPPPPEPEKGAYLTLEQLIEISKQR